jgi:hypothetical protein
VKFFVLSALALSACSFGVAPLSADFDDAGNLVVADDAGMFDLAAPADLEPLRDLALPPDLTPIPTYVGKVQPDVSAMGCDSVACHGSTNPAAPKPVLLASPSSMSAVSFNYGDVLPFAASGTLLSRPLATSGGTHPKFFSTVADARYQAWSLWVRGGEPLQ